MIVDVLMRHDTMHKGDDVQQGLILHCLAGKSYFLAPERHHTGNYKVRARLAVDAPRMAT